MTSTRGGRTVLFLAVGLLTIFLKSVIDMKTNGLIELKSYDLTRTTTQLRDIFSKCNGR